MNNRSARATSNLAMLEMVARKLGGLNDEVVYLGGCTTALFINDPLSLDVRSTTDVDCIIDIMSLRQYHQFENKLSEIGFKKSMEDSVICRWHHDDIILDVMPTNEKILGFGNRWYKEAIDYAQVHQIADDLAIKSVNTPYFLATKIEAFKTRGNNDFLGSHDFEDIITIIGGRVEIADEVALASDELKLHLRQIFEKMLKNDQFELALPGHLRDGPVTMQRVQIVKDRFRKIIEITNG